MKHTIAVRRGTVHVRVTQQCTINVVFYVRLFICCRSGNGVMIHLELYRHFHLRGVNIL